MRLPVQPAPAFCPAARLSLKSAKVESKSIAAAMTMSRVALCRISARCFRVGCAIAAAYGMAKLCFNAIFAADTPSAR
jgi:O-acetyl-ADP-ribose deacetylase (regulator of RNase III)